MPAVNTGNTAYFWSNEGFYYDAMTSLWVKITVLKQREVMYIIDRFYTETPHGESPCKKKMFLSLIRFIPPGQTPKIKICHMVEREPVVSYVGLVH